MAKICGYIIAHLILGTLIFILLANGVESISDQGDMFHYGDVRENINYALFILLISQGLLNTTLILKSK